MSRHEDYDERFGELARLSYQVAYRLTGDRHEAEDHAQEAMTRAYLSWSRMHGHAEAWVVRVTTNLVIGRWRRGRRSAPFAAPEQVHHGSDHGMADRLALVQALRALPRRQRQVAVLRYVGDLSIEDTAAALGCTPGTVKQHSARALVALRAAVDAPGADSGAPVVHPPVASTPRSAGVTRPLRAPRVDAPSMHPTNERTPDVHRS